jgi:hypothetical protein
MHQINPKQKRTAVTASPVNALLEAPFEFATATRQMKTAYRGMER